MYKHQINNFNGVGFISLCLLSLIMFALFSPTVESKAKAAPLTATAGVAITANAMATLAISLDNQVNIDITPTSNSNGVFSSGTSKLSISTNNTSGYSIYMNTVGETGNLEPITSNTSDISIAPVSTNTIGNNFTGNTWGYNLAKTTDTSIDATDLTYEAIPTDNTRAVLVSDSANLEIADGYDLTFGVNIDSTLPAGTYTNSVLVSAVANPITVSELSQLTYLQDMTSNICENTTMPFTNATGEEVTATKQLVDTRDGKKYWVAKLRDGNCWMTQNLALDLTTTGLTATSTDILTDWNSESPYPPTNTNGFSFTGSKTQLPDTASWSWGQIVMATPDRVRELGGRDSDRGVLAWCNNRNDVVETSSTKFHTFNSAYSTDNLVDVCGHAGFVDVSGPEWKPTFTAQQGTFQLPNGETYTGIIAVNYSEKTYDAHFLLGNFYSVLAATTGADSNIATQDISSSICPKGWKLPTSGDDSFNQTGSFAYLMKQYGLAADASTGPAANDKFSNTLAPLYFLRSGFITHSDGTYRFAGIDGRYLSATKPNANSLIYMAVTENLTSPSFQYMTGTTQASTLMSVRCINRK